MSEQKEIQSMPEGFTAEEKEARPNKIKPQTEAVPIRVTDKRFWVTEQEGEEDGPKFSLKPTYVEELEKKLSDRDKQLDEVRASYREFRANAEVENQQARERIRNEYNKRVIQATGEIVQEFIDIFENLERALTSKGNPSFKGLLEGVELIRNQFRGVLSELGLEEVVKVGELYNPELAEAIAVVEVFKQEEDNLILEIVNKGYRLNGALIRPARVKVGQVKSTAPSLSG